MVFSTGGKLSRFLLARLTWVVRQPVADFDLFDAGIAIALGALSDFEEERRRVEIPVYGTIEEHSKAQFLRARKLGPTALAIFDLRVENLFDCLGEGRAWRFGRPLTFPETPGRNRRLFGGFL
ncbi:hypothetical protein CR492_20150 [Methylocella silvestris]|uniref:Uncharacterized protein n=1 Tax=Methylocella silvestris TaxID=199596 RepID=A0A2J7TBN5_METSI|nr:hypothetical protein CR492_20150 [Methylocella silvestris]